jgi:hypothetical protein
VGVTLRSDDIAMFSTAVVAPGDAGDGMTC